MRIDIATLFPDMCRSFLSESVIGRAIKGGHIDIRCHNIRDYAGNKHNRVDDKPYGGGTGMLMQAQPIYDCITAIREDTAPDRRVIYMSPQGRPLSQQTVKELADSDGFIILCGHYEGVDCRVLEELKAEEISVGDFVVTGGELPALMLADAAARLIPGVLPNDEAYEQDSHFDRLLEYPQYSRPEVWRGRAVPQVLLSGDHKLVKQWQDEMKLAVTLAKRPDLLVDRRNNGKPLSKYVRFAVRDEGLPEDIFAALTMLSKNKALNSKEKKVFVKIDKYFNEFLPFPKEISGEKLFTYYKTENRDIVDMCLSLCDIFTAHEIKIDIIYSEIVGKIVREDGYRAFCKE